jgi:hypothetical protein
MGGSDGEGREEEAGGAIHCVDGGFHFGSTS